MAISPQKGKRSLIDKANSSMVISIAVAGFILVFSLVASRALLAQRSYQSRVIDKKQVALDQLDANVAAVDKLAVAYKEFVGTPDNVLGGNPSGTGDKDGDNAKIVLDALPSKYDFPAFVTSIQKLLSTKNITITSINGTDDELVQGAPGQANAAPVEIPFTVNVSVDSYASAQDFLRTLQKSIRPIKVGKLEITGGGNQLTMSVTATSYYQAEKGLTITKEEVE